MTQDYDLIVVGSGVAGLYGALCAATEARVVIVS
jgi:aspartate oxidase